MQYKFWQSVAEEAVKTEVSEHSSRGNTDWQRDVLWSFSKTVVIFLMTLVGNFFVLFECNVKLCHYSILINFGYFMKCVQVFELNKICLQFQLTLHTLIHIPCEGFLFHGLV